MTITWSYSIVSGPHGVQDPVLWWHTALWTGTSIQSKACLILSLPTGTVSISSYPQVLQKKKKNCIIISKASSFTGKKNLDLRISVKHIPTGPCGQTSSMHKLQNNGERNHKNPSSRAIKSFLRILAISPVLVREKSPLSERWYKSVCPTAPC